MEALRRIGLAAKAEVVLSRADDKAQDGKIGNPTYQDELAFLRAENALLRDRYQETLTTCAEWMMFMGEVVDLAQGEVLDEPTRDIPRVRAAFLRAFLSANNEELPVTTGTPVDEAVARRVNESRANVTTFREALTTTLEEEFAVDL